MHHHAFHSLRNFSIAVGTAIFVNQHLYEITSITGSSMSPTLSPNYKTTGAVDALLWRKTSPTNNLTHGSIILFSLPHNPAEIGVKRVIALPGDTVFLDPRRRPWEIVDGRESEDAKRWDRWRGRVEVPEGHVWVEGDNWRETRDSNWYGPISKSLIRGRAVCAVWPWERFSARPWEGFRGRTRVLIGKERKAGRDAIGEELRWWEAG